MYILFNWHKTVQRLTKKGRDSAADILVLTFSNSKDNLAIEKVI